jgi:hypothetical protein
MKKLLFFLVLTLCCTSFSILSGSTVGRYVLEPAEEQEETQTKQEEHDFYKYLEPIEEPEKEVVTFDIFDQLAAKQAEQKNKSDKISNEFAERLEKCENLATLDRISEDFDRSIRLIYESEEEAAQVLEDYIEKHKTVLLKTVERFRDESLEKNGLILKYPPRAYYVVHFKTKQKKFSFSKLEMVRHLQFNITEFSSSYLTYEKLGKGTLVILDKDKFKVASVPVESIEPGKTVVGEIELTESEYQKIDNVELHNE